MFDYSGVSREILCYVRTLSTPVGTPLSIPGGVPDEEDSVSGTRMQRPKVRFCLVFERELLSVPVMRQVLGDTLRGIGVNEDSVSDILLAATEACTNVVQHADSTSRYKVTVGDDGQLVVDKSKVFKMAPGTEPDEQFAESVIKV